MLRETLNWLNSQINKDITHNTPELRELVERLIEYNEPNVHNELVTTDVLNNQIVQNAQNAQNDENEHEQDEDEDVDEDYEKSKPKVKDQYDGQYNDQVGGSRRVRFFNMFKKLTRRFKSKKSRGKRRMNKSKKCSKKKSKRRR
jgi:hypothetical protein